MRTLQLLSLSGLLFATLCVAGEPAAKTVLKLGDSAENLLKPDAWQPWQKGFARDGDLLLCDNGADTRIQRGAGQSVQLNQSTPEPIVAVAFSRAEGVAGAADNDYSLYLDLIYTDGTTLWGQAAPFGTGTHDWQRRQVLVLPEKPVRQVSFYLLLRGHTGKVWFRDPQLQVIKAPEGACMFDGLPVVPQKPSREGFQIRDVAAGSDFVHIDREALGLKLDCKTSEQATATFFDVTLSDTTGRDRAVTLVYAVPVQAERLRWLHDPRRTERGEPQRQYVNASRCRVGSSGHLSRYPLAAVGGGDRGLGLGIDMAYPALYRIGCNSGTNELYLAYTSAHPRRLLTCMLILLRYWLWKKD